MGTQQSSISSLFSLPSELKLLDSDKQLYMNTSSNKKYIKNRIMASQLDDIEYHKDLYLFRRLHEKYLVSVDFCSISQKSQLCSGFTTIDYFIQYPESRLSSLTWLDSGQGLKMLKHVLKAFEILYQKFGYFLPNSKMVIFNSFNESKVWISQNTSATKIANHSNKIFKKQDEFIRQVVYLFNSLKDPKQPMFVYSAVLPNRLITFEEIFPLIDLKIKARSNPQSFRKSSKAFFVQPVRVPEKLVVRQQLNSPRVLQFQQNRPIMMKNIPERRREKLKFVYHSPRNSHAETKNIVNESQSPYFLKNSQRKSINFEQKSMMNSNVQIISSTMPNSMRNSLVRWNNADKTQSSKNKAPKASHIRYSQAEYQEGMTENSEYRISEIPKDFNRSDSNPLLENFKVSNIPVKSILSSCRSQNEQFKPNYKRHKRNQTDLKFVQNSRKFLEEANQNETDHMIKNSFQNASKTKTLADLPKDRMNTIKSIHLLDSDLELNINNEILSDLKHIFNKYQLRDS